MNVLIASDKFKGSLTAEDVCTAVKRGVLEVDSTAKITLLPLADGGEGTLDILSDILSLETVHITVRDPLFREIQSNYCLKGEYAYVEMARASGFELLADKERSATVTSTIGTGELIRDAIDQGAKNVYLFVGGSATNDGGIGMASVLGFQFLDAHGKVIIPIGDNLSKITKIKAEDFPDDLSITLITDVKNKLLGPKGASYQYGPQKGATSEEIKSLDEGLKHLCDLVKDQFGKNVSEIPGCGAAGGTGLTVLGLMDGVIQNGIETILDLIDFDEKLKGTDLVITGEGKIDQQTLQGKVVYGVANASRFAKIPVVAICGLNELETHELELIGIRDVESIKKDQLSVEYCMKNASKLTQDRAAELIRRNGLNL